MWRMDIDPSELKNAVERMHHCSARLIQSIPIREWFENETVREGAVHIFDLEGHPTASRAYAWSSSIEGSDKRRFFAVLHQPPITSPVDAVRAAIVVCIENLIRFECLTESLIGGPPPKRFVAVMIFHPLAIHCRFRKLNPLESRDARAAPARSSGAAMARPKRCTEPHTRPC